MSQERAEDKVQGSFFDTRGLSAREAAASWSQAMGVLFDVRIGGGEGVERFHGRVDGYALDQLLVGRSQSTAQAFDRSRYRTARDGLSHYLLQFYVKGGSGRRDDASDMWARPGDLLVIDLTQPLATAATDFENLNLFIPRRLLAPLLKTPDDVHMRIIRREDPLVGFLRGHLEMLANMAPSLARRQAAGLMRPTVELAAAAINGHVDEASTTAANQCLLERICHRLETQLTSKSLTARDIAGAFGISERKLYYLFEALGGFSAYVQQRRLRAIRTRLADPSAEHETIASISETYGFTHRSSFVSAFRGLYGMTPREFRSLAALREPPHGAAPRADWRQWIADLR